MFSKQTFMLFMLRFVALSALCCSCDDEQVSDASPTDVGVMMDMGEPLTSDQGPDAQVAEPLIIEPGRAIGGARLGMSVRELKEALGEPDRQLGFRRTINLRYEQLGLEVVVITQEDNVVDDESLVVSVGTLEGVTLEPPLTLGLTLEALSVERGERLDINDTLSYFPSQGLAVELDVDKQVTRYGVWAPFNRSDVPPPMEPALGNTWSPAETMRAEQAPSFTFEDETYEVIDAHLHTGVIEQQLWSGLTYLVNSVPPPAQLYFPSSVSLVLDPYDPKIGIKEHLRAAGVSRGVLLATYTHHTIGYTTNRQLEALLTDPKNHSLNGLPWAWGMVSVNYDQFENEAVASQRLEALGSYFERQPELLIGIKLAHAHQAVRFDDPIYLGVYDVAARYQKAVLLHTGFSPFPNTQREPEYYDPASLEAVIEQYDGHHGQGRVEFVLSHIGQGDERSIDHSLSLAERFDHVWLELSAINQPLRIDADGQELESPSPGHILTLTKIKERGLVDRLIFATDGPQYFGKSQSYLKLIMEAMRDTGYSVEERRAVLAENFYRCFML